MIKEKFVLHKEGNENAIISIIKTFEPLLLKYCRKIYYEDIYTDLVILLIEIADKINLVNFESDGEID